MIKKWMSDTRERNCWIPCHRI